MLLKLEGHSQVVGQGDTDKSDPFLALTTAFASVQYNKRYSGSVTNPMVRTTFGTTTLRPYHAGGSAGMGSELTLGRELVKLGLSVGIISDGINGSTAAQFKPSASPDSSGLNLFQQTQAYSTAQEAAFTDTIGVIVLWQGENDANTLTDANNFATNLAAIVAAHRAARPNVKIIIPLLSNQNTSTYRATVRAAQESVIAANSSSMLGVKHDDLTLGDGVHLTANSYSTLGQRLAYAAGTLLGTVRPVNAGPAPMYMGSPPTVFGAGDLVPPSWPGQVNKDKEILVVLTAQNNAVPSLTVSAGFALVPNIGLSTYAGSFYIRLAVYHRDVDATLFVDGRMPPPTVHGGNAMNLAVCHTVRGITGGNVLIDGGQESSNNDYNVTWSAFAGLATTHANVLVLQPYGGFTGNSLNIASIANALASYATIGSGVYNVGSDYLIAGLAQGLKSAAGTIAASTVTTTANAILAGMTLALYGVPGYAPTTGQSVDWTDVENLIWTWIWQGSGLAPEQVIWAGQPCPQPGSLYVDIAIENLTRIGLGDSITWRTNPAFTPGAEALFVCRGQQRCTLSIRCFAGAAVGATRPLAILNEILSSLADDAIAVPLARLVGIGSNTDVQMINGVVGSTLLEPRAQVFVKCFIGSEKIRTVGSIDTVNVTDQIPNPNETLHIVKP